MDYDTLLSRLAARCSAAELCTADIRHKLEATDLTPDECERLLRHMIEEGYVDDSRYARAFVRDKFRFSGWGRVKIAQGLRAKQLPEAIISEALIEIDEDDYRRALAELLCKGRKTIRGRTPYETNGKLIRFAMGRGYELPLIMDELKADGFDLD